MQISLSNYSRILKRSRWLADVTLARTVRRLDEHMGRLQRSLYNMQRKKKLYKENRLSPPSEENKMTISPAIIR